MRTLRLVEIAELLGVTKQRAHQIAEEKGFPAPIAEDARGRVWEPVRGAGVGEALASREALALAHELHAVGVAGVHERLQDRRVLSRRFGVELVERHQAAQRERREPAADVRLDCDEMTADPDDGDAGDATRTYMNPVLAMPS